MQDFVLEEYINKGIRDIMKDIVKAIFKDPAESLFMAKFAASVKRAGEIRTQYEKEGEHIPPFLIASITSNCNLHCKGCYARENQICLDEKSQEQLSDEEWSNIFAEAKELGISFVLLVGGEPLMRPDVLEKAALYPDILFPVFTNGTIMTDAFLKLFVNHRNLVPVVSVEGHAQSTDARRGEGTFKQLDQTMNRLKNAGLLFGASITVTRENMDEVLSDAFVEELVEKGCRAVLYIEYVPVDEISMQLAPTPKDNVEIEKRVRRLRETFDKLLFISFPGDEHKSGGCLAAGRGFFHINPKGGAEPCPASPYSDSDIRKLGVRGALKSPLFRILREGKILMENHAGGCVLFENRQNMDTLIRKSYIQKERMVEEFMELTSIDSVSFKERKMADALKKKLADLGVEVYEDDAGKDCGGNAGNVYGYLKGTLPGAPLLFSAHMDTVEPGIGKKPVYQPDGKITSQGDTVLGADDVAGIEAILEAIRCIQEHQIPHRDIEVVFPVAEEVYGLGSVRFDYQKLQAKEAYVLDLSGEIGTASLQEPTLISFCIKIHGKASHSGFAPELGVHAIAIAAEAIEKIKQGRVDEETTVNIGMISGGAATNIVPELVTLKGEVRSYCHEKALVQLQRIGVIFTGVAASRGATCEIEYTIHLKAYQVPEETPVVQRFLHVCDRLGIEGNLTKTFGGSDNNIFLQHGISGIVLACGMHQVHTLQEYTHQDDLTNCAAIVLELMTGEEEIQ